jgi:uracil-DNA glycosylase
MENVSTDWAGVIGGFKGISEIMSSISKDSLDCDVFPKYEHIFRSFNYFNVQETKVVILGQDPYYSRDSAIGLCFGVNRGKKYPPSLSNVMNELVEDIGRDLKSPTLEYWANQGVLLLNTALTVIENKPASHMKLWLPFTKYIIDYIDEHCENVVFVAWGAFAHRKLMNINKEKHTLIVSSHPSPLSAYKNLGKFPAFKGSKPFSKINTILSNKIIW